MVGQGRPDGSFQPQLIAGSRPAATAYVELQGTLPRGTSLSAAFEVAATADGPAIATIAGIIVPVEGAPTRWNARGVIPIGNLAAGEYVVRAAIKVNDAVIARPMRSLRKVQ